MALPGLTAARAGPRSSIPADSAPSRPSIPRLDPVSGRRAGKMRARAGATAGRAAARAGLGRAKGNGMLAHASGRERATAGTLYAVPTATARPEVCGAD